MLAVIFPGQGTQHQGMGYEIYKKYNYVRELYESASKLANFSIPELCFSSNTSLNSPSGTQIAVFMTNCAYWEVFKRENTIIPEFVLGHSLGEYNALYAAECLNFPNLFNLVLIRAHSMEEQARKYPGTLFAILGLPMEEIEELISNMDSKDVGISNINCVGQIVVWVREGKDKKLEEYAKIKGAKRVIPLKVNGCLHSPYMEEVKEKLKETISQLDFKPPRFRLIMNVSGKEENDPQVIKRLLWEQVSSPVQWLKSAENLIKNGVDEVVEVGASNVLSGIMLRINKEWKVWSYNSKIK